MFAISMERGIHNGTLAVFFALSLLRPYELALPVAVYSIFMFGIFTMILIKRNKPAAFKHPLYKFDGATPEIYSSLGIPNGYLGKES